MAKANSKKLSQLAASPYMQELDALAQRRQQFEKTELARTNKKLYQLLADVYAQYELALGNNCLAVTVQIMKDRIKERGQKVQARTAEINVFVRYVFDTDRQRVYNYAACLQAAIAQSIPSTDFVEFITKIGGIEECKQQTTAKLLIKSTATAVSEAATNMASDAIEGRSSEFIADIALPQQLMARVIGQPLTIMIGMPTNQGALRVIATLPADKPVVKSLLTRELARSIDQQSAVTAQAIAIQSRDDAFNTLLENVQITEQPLNPINTCLEFSAETI
jgi:hypothetical protein